MKYVKAVKAIQKETNSRIQFTYTTFVFVKSELCTLCTKILLHVPTNKYISSVLSHLLRLLTSQ